MLIFLYLGVCLWNDVFLESYVEVRDTFVLEVMERQNIGICVGEFFIRLVLGWFLLQLYSGFRRGFLFQGFMDLGIRASVLFFLSFIFVCRKDVNFIIIFSFGSLYIWVCLQSQSVDRCECIGFRQFFIKQVDVQSGQVLSEFFVQVFWELSSLFFLSVVVFFIQGESVYVSGQVCG